MAEQKNEKEMSAEEVVEKNKRDALRLAADVWKIVSKPDFQKIDARTRMRVVQEKVPEFCKAYPAVVRWMVMMLRYSDKAFREYLNMLQREHEKKAAAAAAGAPPPKPGEGYLEYIAKQAEYARILYKCTTPHWNVKQATNIYQNEYNAMIKTYKDMQKEEENVKSEFADEKKTHRSEKIDEIVGFVQNAVHSGDPTDVASRLRRVNEIIDFRMKQASTSDTSTDVSEVPKTQRVVEDDGTVIETVVEDAATVDPAELERRRVRMEAEQRAAEEAEIAAARMAETRETDRAASFVPDPIPPRVVLQHKKSTRSGRSKKQKRSKK